MSPGPTVTLSAEEKLDGLAERGIVEPEPTNWRTLTPQRSAFGLLILLGLQAKPMYRGTVSPAEIAKRRARGKRAKAARKVHRR